MLFFQYCYINSYTKEKLVYILLTLWIHENTIKILSKVSVWSYGLWKVCLALLYVLNCIVQKTTWGLDIIQYHWQPNHTRGPFSRISLGFGWWLHPKWIQEGFYVVSYLFVLLTERLNSSYPWNGCGNSAPANSVFMLIFLVWILLDMVNEFHDKAFLYSLTWGI